MTETRLMTESQNFLSQESSLLTRVLTEWRNDGINFATLKPLLRRLPQQEKTPQQVISFIIKKYRGVAEFSPYCAADFT